MKSNKILLMLLMTVVANAATAVITSDVRLCRIQINSLVKSTVLSLPFTELGATDDAVSLDKIVLTDNLKDGTLLFAKVNGATHAWTLAKGTWQSLVAVDGSHTIDSVGVNSLSRGVAFWVERAGDKSDLEKPFFIYGRVGEVMSGVQQIAAGTPGTDSLGQSVVVPSYTRIGNPNPEDRPFNSLSWSGCSADDEIAVGATNKLGYAVYTYNNGKWGMRETYKQGKVLKTRWNYDVVLPAGEGFWYVRKATSPASVSFAKQQSSNQ